MTQPSHAGGVAGACPDLDTLADLHAGLLDETTASTLRQHIASCSDCTAAMAALDATVTSLGAMPEVTIPADVAARIDAAIAAEAGRVGLSDDTTASLAASSSAAPTSDRRLGSVPNSTATPPSGDRRLGTAPSSAAAPSQAAAAGNVASLATHRQKRGLGRGRLLLAAAAAAVVVGGGAVMLGQGGGGDTNANQADQQTTQAESPDTAEERTEIQAFSAPKDVLEEGAIENEEVSEEVAGKMAEKTARAQCLSQIVPRPASAPEAVQQGTHEGTEAYAFVFPTDEQDIVEMIIVDAADCGTTLDTVTGPRE